MESDQLPNKLNSRKGNIWMVIVRAMGRLSNIFFALNKEFELHIKKLHRNFASVFYTERKKEIDISLVKNQ